jgi:hypothetical protein
MSEITGKSGLNGAITLLFSIFILAGLNMTRAYGQPLDSPLYNHTKTKAVESMNAPAEANLAADANNQVLPWSLSGQATCSACITNEPSTCAPHYTCTPACRVIQSLPVMSPPGEVVFILTLTGGACWAILRKKRP